MEDTIQAAVGAVMDECLVPIVRRHAEDIMSKFGTDEDVVMSAESRTFMISVYEVVVSPEALAHLHVGLRFDEAVAEAMSTAACLLSQRFGTSRPDGSLGMRISDWSSDKELWNGVCDSGDGYDTVMTEVSKRKPEALKAFADVFAAYGLDEEGNIPRGKSETKQVANS